MEDLVATCLERYDDAGDAGVRAVLDAHPDVRDELERRLGELRDLGLFGPIETASDDLELPDRLGEFELRERIGGGGMGVVYRAYQPSLGRDVALKAIRPDLLHVASARERFRREVEAIARLQHPQIVPVHACGEAEGIPYFAMELVAGCTLADALERLDGRNPARLTGADLGVAVAAVSGQQVDDGAFVGTWSELCVRIVRDVGRALEVVHAHGIVHRDVKPSNVMLTLDGRVLLFDFGLMTTGVDGRVTRTGNLVGSPAYMAPEQQRGGAIDARTDVWALAVTLYELLTLELPFLASSRGEASPWSVDRDPVPLRHRNAKLSSDVETICVVGMDRDPARRYASAAAFVRDLDHVLAHEPIEARRPGPFLRLRRFCERRPALAVGAVLGTLLLVGTPVSLWLVQRAANVEIDARRSEAERNLALALEAVDRFLHRFGGDELIYEPHLEDVGRALLDDALALYAALGDQVAAADPRLTTQRARALYNAAWLWQRRGELERAKAFADEAIDRVRERAAVDDAAAVVYARSLGVRGSLARLQSRYAAARADHDAAIAVLARVDDEDAAQFLTAREWNRIGKVELAAGRVESARAAYDRCHALLVALAERGVEGAKPLLYLAHTENSRALVAARQSRWDDHDDHVRAAIARCEALLAAADLNGTEARCERAQAATLWARGRRQRGTADEVRAAREDALARWRPLADEFPTNRRFGQGCVDALLLAAEAAVDDDDSDGALGLLDDADARLAALPNAPSNADLAALGLRSARQRSRALVRLGEREAAAERLGACLTELRDVLGSDIAGEHALFELAKAANELGTLRRGLDDADGAERAYRDAIAAKVRLVALQPDSALYRASLANSEHNLAGVFVLRDENDQARSLLDDVIARRLELHESAPDDHRLWHVLAGSHYGYGMACENDGDVERALTSYAEALRWARGAVERDATSRGYARRLHDICCDFADTALRLGRRGAALTELEAFVAADARSRAAPLRAAGVLAIESSRVDGDDTWRATARARALTWLRVAVDRGYRGADRVANDPRFEALRDDPDFVAVLEAMR